MLDYNIVIAVFDSVAPRYISQWGGGIDFLAAIPEAPLTFTNYYSTASCTAPAIASILTGLYPLKHLVTRQSSVTVKLTKKHPTLASILSKHGHDTLLCVPEGWANGLYDGVRLSRGFNRRYVGGTSPEKSKVSAKYIEKADTMLGDRPFFVFFHDFSTHSPYGAKSFRERDSEDAYKDRIKQIADTVIPSLWEFSQKRNALLFILSDHGEIFTDMRTRGYHSKYLKEATLRSMAYAFRIDLGTNDRLHSHVDIMPTILKTLEIECPPCDGVNLIGEEHEEVFAISAWAKKKWKRRIATVKKDGTITRAVVDIPETAVVDLGDEVAIRLRALGYVD